MTEWETAKKNLKKFLRSAWQSEIVCDRLASLAKAKRCKSHGLKHYEGREEIRRLLEREEESQQKGGVYREIDKSSYTKV